MILWISGNSKAGKTTLANQLKGERTIVLDGDRMRATISRNAGFSKKDRWEHNLRTARLAKELEGQGFRVIVSLICPYRDLRKKVRDITNCKFLYLAGGKKHKDFPYEDPIGINRWTIYKEP